MGQGRQRLSVRRTRWKDVARRPVQGTQPARGAARHVRAGLERGLQELLVLGRWLRTDGPASCRPRYHDGRGFPRAAAKARRVQAADGLEFPRSVKLKPGETVVFAWITYKSRAQR